MSNNTFNITKKIGWQLLSLLALLASSPTTAWIHDKNPSSATTTAMVEPLSKTTNTILKRRTVLQKQDEETEDNDNDVSENPINSSNNNIKATKKEKIHTQGLTIRGGGDGLPKRRVGVLDNYITKMFQDADTNRDGSISPSEVYELVLKFYVKVNQQAPIPPPSRARVMYLFRQADLTRNGTLSEDEFRRLIKSMYARASSRVVVHKVVQLVCAPAAALAVVTALQCHLPVKEFLESILPEQTPESVANFLGKESLWVTILTVLFVKQLDKIGLGLVDLLWWKGNPEKQYEDVDQLQEK